MQIRVILAWLSPTNISTSKWDCLKTSICTPTAPSIQAHFWCHRLGTKGTQLLSVPQAQVSIWTPLLIQTRPALSETDPRAKAQTANASSRQSSRRPYQTHWTTSRCPSKRLRTADLPTMWTYRHHTAWTPWPMLRWTSRASWSSWVVRSVSHSRFQTPHRPTQTSGTTCPLERGSHCSAPSRSHASNLQPVTTTLTCAMMALRKWTGQVRTD